MEQERPVHSFQAVVWRHMKRQEVMPLPGTSD